MSGMRWPVDSGTVLGSRTAAACLAAAAAAASGLAAPLGAGPCHVPVPACQGVNVVDERVSVKTL